MSDICILLDASTVTQILKIRRATVSDIIAIQLTEQNNRTATILCQALQSFCHLRNLNIERLLSVKSYQAKVVDKDYPELPFCIHHTDLGYDICKRSRGVHPMFETSAASHVPFAISLDDKSSGIRLASTSEEDARRLILNTYKTLLTRGKKGCYVYCEDDALREHFKRMAKQS